MTSQQLDEEKIFHVARTMDDPAIRSEYLNQVCAGSIALRERVDSLLKLHDQETGFLKSNPNETPTASHAPITEKPGTTIGRYKLMEQIGEGGMGTVFVAEQERPIRRKVALKVIKPGMDSKAVIARFEAERQALAMMDHPNIAKVLDAGTTESGLPFFAMELVKGISLTDYCDKNKLSIRERLHLFTQVCQAIQHAHQKGIIHRDIKPSNVLVTLHDGQPVPKVIDFGVAKAVNARLTDKTIYTEHLQIVGTLLYMSPEQAELSGLDVDTRSDVYSLGVLLYELLTGTTPFQKADLENAGFDEKRRMIREDDPPRASMRISSLGETATTIAAQRQTDPNKLNQQVRGDLDWIVLRALEKDRTRRYESATELAKDVERYLSDDAVVARPPSASYRMSKYVRRNKTGILVVSVIFATLLAATISSLYQANKQRKLANDLAEKNQQYKELLETNQDLFFEKAFAGALAGGDNSRLIEDARTAGVPSGRIDALEGFSLQMKGEPELAISKLEAVVAADSGNVMAWSFLTILYEDSLQFEKRNNAFVALAALNLENDYDILVAGYKVESVNDKRTLDSLNKAIDKTRELIEKHPTWISARVFLTLGLILHSNHSGDPQFAEEALDQWGLFRQITPDALEGNIASWVELWAMICIIDGKRIQNANLKEIEEWEKKAMNLAECDKTKLTPLGSFSSFIYLANIGKFAQAEQVLKHGQDSHGESFTSVTRRHQELIQLLNNGSGDGLVSAIVSGDRSRTLEVIEGGATGLYTRMVAKILCGEKNDPADLESENLMENTPFSKTHRALIQALKGTDPKDQEREIVESREKVQERMALPLKL